MLNVTFRPLESWPGKPTPGSQRKSAPFRASYVQTLTLLEKELAAIRATDIVIQAEFRHNQIRNDGWPYSTARPAGPAIILHFTKSSDIISMPCDRFNSFDDNLRAIALSLEALRKVDRYGVTRGSEQYQGFKRLAAADLKTELDWAVEFVTNRSPFRADEILLGKDYVDAAYREAAKRTHPDAGGSGEAFLHLQKAKAILYRHHGVSA